MLRVQQGLVKQGLVALCWKKLTRASSWAGGWSLVGSILSDSRERYLEFGNAVMAAGLGKSG